MDLESMRQLKLDVRMLRRRGWIEEKELQKELAALPDVGDKAAVSEVEPPGDDG